ncbi:MAG: hypothetical protein JF595_04035 [Sphingomonadales bacterium]|nr:hypothetical protein [Sphingomonadales bacterium]
MRKRSQAMLAGGAAAAITAAVLFVPGAANRAADHLDPPGRTDLAVDPTPDLPADIADIFTWYSGDTVKVIVTFGGPNGANLPASYDRDVLYKINISTAAPTDTPEVTIKVRFGPGQRPGEWGVRFEGIPGVNGTIEGPVETTLVKDGVKARAGLFDEPFFFDLVGFRETRAMGTLRFNNKRNFFDAQNDTAIVLEIPKDRFAGATTPLGFWTTTARFGGQL